MTVQARAIKSIWGWAKFINGNFARYQRTKFISHSLPIIKIMLFLLLYKAQCVPWPVFPFVSTITTSVSNICPSRSEKDHGDLLARKECPFSQLSFHSVTSTLSTQKMSSEDCLYLPASCMRRNKTKQIPFLTRPLFRIPLDKRLTLVS